jgi:hypothetical protein
MPSILNSFRASGDILNAYYGVFMSIGSYAPITILDVGTNLRKFGLGVLCA